MLIGLASIILAIVFAFRAYNTAEMMNVAKAASENIRIAAILISTALALTLLGIIISFFISGSVALQMPQNVSGSGILFTGLALIVGILMIVGLVYAWIAFTEASETVIETDVLIAAIAITVAIASPFLSKRGIASIPVLGDAIYVNANIYPDVAVNVPFESMGSNDVTDPSTGLILPRLQKRK